jgi:DNA-binding winged helix-turn-helix (wHTH) protein
MPNQVGTRQVIRFATFEVDLQAQELRKGGLRLKLSGQPFQVLAILLEQPGVVVTREELQKRLWPDTFVDVDHNLNTAINKIREALGDSSESPRFVETLPRRGYRFIAPITVNGTAAAAVMHTPGNRSTSVPKSVARTRPLLASGLLGTVMVLVATGLWIYERSETPGPPPQRMLTRITFDDGLQSEPTWSPDGRYIAYSSDRGGKFDIWVQQVSGGDPIQITKGPGHHWQPDTSSQLLGVPDSPGRSLLLGITLAGRRTACSCCFRLISLRQLFGTGSTSDNLMVAHPATFWSTSSRKINCRRVQPSGTRMERESLFGSRIFRQVPAFGQYRLPGGSESNWKLLLRSRGNLLRLLGKVKSASS